MTTQLQTLLLTTLADIRAAQDRVSAVCLRTPLVKLEGAGDGAFELFAKAENLQPIGSFKLRGAYNKISQLSQEQKSRGVITYSSGNHAQGVAFAARAAGTKAVVVMPSNAPEVKRKATEAQGAEIITVGPASAERQQRAEALAAEHGYVVIPPYDDADIIAGAATCGAEILEDMPDVDLILVPVGGGGLLSGVSAAAKLLKPSVKVVGVEPELAGDAAESFKAGKIIRYTAEQTSRTMADGLRTQSVGALNFMHIQEFVDDIVRVSEDEIVAAMKKLLVNWRLVAEPSGAVTTAAALFKRNELPTFRKSVVVLTGGNLEPSLLKSLL
jgi:threonine dehydratase